MTLCEERLPETFREASIPVLETERLVLRAPRLEDAKAVALLVNDRRIAENTARIPHPYRLSDAETFIASANQLDGETVFLLTLRDGTVIGACGLMQDTQSPELGYWLGVEYWGNGYATEALHAVIDHVFMDLAYDAVTASARVTNPSSRRVLEKCGFQWTGVGLCRIRALSSSVPIDHFRLERRVSASLKAWGAKSWGAKNWGANRKLA